MQGSIIHGWFIISFRVSRSDSKGVKILVSKSFNSVEILVLRSKIVQKLSILPELNNLKNWQDQSAT